VIDVEQTAVIGAGPWERSDARPRALSTPAGDLELPILKLLPGFFSSLLGRRRRVDQALFAVVMGAYLYGVSRVSPHCSHRSRPGWRWWW
jgi:putative transposase